MPRVPRLFMVVAALLLGVSAPAPAQSGKADDETVTRGYTADPAAPSGKEQPVLAYFLALAGTGAALLIVCSPARKK